MRRFLPLLFALLAVLLALTLAAPHSVIEPRRKHIFDKPNNDNFQSFRDNLHCFAMDGPTWVMEDWAQFFNWANTTQTGKPPPLPLDDLKIIASCAKGVMWEQIHNGVGDYVDNIATAALPLALTGPWEKLGEYIINHPIREALIKAELLDAVAAAFADIRQVSQGDAWSAGIRGLRVGVKGQELSARIQTYNRYIGAICHDFGCPDQGS
ncbi:hypothetical protein CBOM_01442 [Ceraceosorus bombacis]|uniref:Uncharacterized protein n=1 Tax=Ceraceosorus bombacis TaxID=401625 RepID=A0A0P1BBM7_9BASI|nr:hypothetical protein CBOM_01442 [Ceraceosorus bombacis]